MRLVITLAAVFGLLLFLSADCLAGAKAKCKDGSCAVEKSTAKATTVAKTTEKTALTTHREKHAKRERVRHHRGLKLRLPKLFRERCE